MLEEGITRLAIHSLIGSSEKERECAVKMLLEFSNDEACCIKIASEKGALVLLSSMAGNMEHPGLSNLAEEVLKQMEKVEGIVQHLAEAGRFDPLLTRLCEGTPSNSFCFHLKLINFIGVHLKNQSFKFLGQSNGIRSRKQETWGFSLFFFFLLSIDCSVWCDFLFTCYSGIVSFWKQVLKMSKLRWHLWWEE